MTKKRNVEELLKKVSPPDVSLPSAKASLRRELVNSRHFKKKTAPRLLFKYSLRVVPVLGIILLALVLRFIPGEMSAMERLEHLESTYRNTFTGDGIHYLKIRSSEFREKEGRPVIEMWRYRTDKARILLQYETSGKIAGHMIVKGLKTFLWLDETAEDGVKIGKDYHKKEPGRKDLTGVKDENEGKMDKKGTTMRAAYSTIALDVKKRPGQKPGTKRISAIISKDSIDVFGFTHSDPANIFNRLKSSPDITYSGSEADENTELDIFERGNSEEMRAFMLEYDEKIEKRLEPLLDQLRRNEIPFSNDPEGSDKKEGDIAMVDGFKIEKIEVKEITKVDKSSGRITAIIHRTFHRGEIVSSHEMTFMNEQSLEYDSRIFDEKLYGLKEFSLPMNPEAEEIKKQ